MSSPEVLIGGGGSIGVNPTVADIDITRAATDFLWAVFAIMLFSDLAFLFISYRRPLGTRLFHQLPVLILTTASIAYFSMASDLGSVAVRAEYPRGAAYGVTRSIWYARYIDWTITTPLLLLELLLNTGLPLSEILTVIFMDLVMIITGLLGALTPTRYKWGYFTFGCAALIYIWWILMVKARAGAGALGNDVRKAYTGSAAWLSVLWLLYPICWGVADGGNVISPLKEMVFYGILDVLAKPVFCAYHIFALRNIPYERFLLSSGKASMGLAAGASAVGAAGIAATEKTRPSTASNAPLTGNNNGRNDIPMNATNHNNGLAPNMGNTATSAGDTAGGPLNGRHGLTHRNSARAVAEEGRM